MQRLVISNVLVMPINWHSSQGLHHFIYPTAVRGKDVATKQGNRRLQTTIYFLAIQMVQLSSKGTPRNPVVRAYYEKRKAEGKTSQQALICISRRLISIIYGMLKNGTEYRMPVVENAGENR